MLYGWWDLTAGGALVTPAAPNGHGNGAGNGGSPIPSRARAPDSKKHVLRRPSQPCSNGAIVSPAPFSCSQ